MSASFDAYKVFYYVGKYKNITHAATALFLSQSTVSRSIQSLESELGCKLFTRTQNGVAFTIEGEVLYRHVSAACEQIFYGQNEVFRLQKLTEGSLRLGMSDITFQQFILPVLKEFHAEYPSMHVDILSTATSSFDEIVKALMEQKIDIACVVSPDDASFINGAVNVTPIAAFGDMVIASKSFPELRKGSYRFSDLAAYPFVSLINNNSSTSFLERLFVSRGQDVNVAYKVNSLNMFLPLVKHCQCLAVVPTLFRDEFKEEDPVFEVTMSEPLMTHQISIVTVKSAPDSTVREIFIRRLKKYIQTRIDFVENQRPLQ